jgi:signal transduction histidine kinase
MAIDLYPEAHSDTGRRLVEAADEERRRTARVLREGPVRDLRHLGLDLRLARSLIADDPDLALAVLDEATARVDAAADAVRDAARDVSPAELGRSRGLADALGALSETAPITVVVMAAPAERLPRDAEAAAYAVAAEGVLNAVAHSRATVVELDVRLEDDELSVRVTDDGLGGAVVRPGGRLEALSDRVAILGGELSIESPPWAGTALVAVLPL